MLLLGRLGPSKHEVSDLKDPSSNFPFVVPTESLLVASRVDDGHLMGLLEQVDCVLLSLRGLSGTESWGTQRGGANNYQTVMLPNRQERNYTSCPTTEGWLRLARPLRAGSASPNPRGLDSTSPDA